MNHTTPSKFRIIIPVSEELHNDVVLLAQVNKIKISELGRKLFEDYLVTERKRLRREALAEAVNAYADVIAEVQHEWRHTEVEGWPDD